MFIVVSYDVNTETKEGQSRLRKIAKICNNYGVRAQNSVFECVVDRLQFFQLRREIEEVICHETDSIRYYNMGKSGRERVINVGINKVLNVEEPLIF